MQTHKIDTHCHATLGKVKNHAWQRLCMIQQSRKLT